MLGLARGVFLALAETHGLEPRMAGKPWRCAGADRYTGSWRVEAILLPGRSGKREVVGSREFTDWERHRMIATGDYATVGGLEPILNPAFRPDCLKDIDVGSLHASTARARPFRSGPRYCLRCAVAICRGETR